MENVIQMPTKDDRIADDIRSHIEGMKNAECDWRDHAVALCECVAAAKARYPSTKAFGAWWDAQGFDMNSDTRAALVAMGQDVARAREVLAVTERRSLHTVYTLEFKQVRNVSKSPEPKQSAPKKPEDAIARDNRVADIADVLLADMEDGTPFPSAEEIKQKFECGIKTASNGLFTARYALRSARAAADAVTPAEPVAMDDLTADEKDKVDRAIKQQLRKLQDGFHDAVKKEYQQFIVRMHADWKRKIEFAEKYSDGTRREKFPLTRKQFKELLFFTHPDRQDASLRERAAEIFSVVKLKEDSLVMPDPPSGGPAFPSSPDDLLRTAKQ